MSTGKYLPYAAAPPLHPNLSPWTRGEGGTRAQRGRGGAGSAADWAEGPLITVPVGMPVVMLAPIVMAPGPFARLVVAPDIFAPVGIATPPALCLGLRGGRRQPQGDHAGHTQQHCNAM